MKYFLVQPGGPQGNFWGIISEKGHVIAMQITNERDAKLFVSALEERDINTEVLPSRPVPSKPGRNPI